MLRNTRKTIEFLSLCCLLVTFMSCQTATENANDKVAKIEVNKLLGKWQSVTNPKNVIELTNDRMFSYYDGLKLADESLTVYDNCIARCIPEGVAKMPCMVTDGKQAQNCFEVLELTDKSLSYALLGADRQVRKYQKM